MRRNRFSRAPGSLRREGVHLDNVALVPASLLPFNAHWQQIAKDLPRGDILIIRPYQAKQQRVVRTVASQLKYKGQRVRVMNQGPLRNAP